jgi:hypothetical protein
MQLHILQCTASHPPPKELYNKELDQIAEFAKNENLEFQDGILERIQASTSDLNTSSYFINDYLCTRRQIA